MVKNNSSGRPISPARRTLPHIRFSRRNLYIYFSTLPRPLQRGQDTLCMAFSLFLHIFCPCALWNLPNPPFALPFFGHFFVIWHMSSCYFIALFVTLCP